MNDGHAVTGRAVTAAKTPNGGELGCAEGGMERVNCLHPPF